MMTYMIGPTNGERVKKAGARIAEIVSVRSSPVTNHPSGGAGASPGPVSRMGHLLVTKRDETNLASNTPTGRFLRLFLVCLAVFVGALMILPQIM